MSGTRSSERDHAARAGRGRASPAASSALRPNGLSHSTAFPASSAGATCVAVQERRRVHRDQVDIGHARRARGRGVVAGRHDVDDLAAVGLRRTPARRPERRTADPRSRCAPAAHSPHSLPTVGSGSAHRRRRDGSGRNQWPSGPMPNANSTVPMPTSPPSANADHERDQLEHASARSTAGDRAPRSRSSDRRADPDRARRRCRAPCRTPSPRCRRAASPTATRALCDLGEHVER